MRNKYFKFTYIAFLIFQFFTSAFCSFELNKKGVLQVATSGKFPPFSMLNEKGELVGIEIDLIKEVSRRLNLKYEPILTNWESILIGVLTNTFDISTEPMDITPERAEKVLFVNWLQSGGTLVTKKTSQFSTLSDIKDKKIGTVSASTWQNEAKRLGINNLYYYPSETMALMDLINGNLDCVITDKINADYFIKKTKDELKALDIILLKVQKGWAFNKNKVNLHAAVQKTLIEIYQDGTYKKIALKYINHDPYPN